MVVVWEGEIAAWEKNEYNGGNLLFPPTYETHFPQDLYIWRAGRKFFTYFVFPSFLHHHSILHNVYPW